MSLIDFNFFTSTFGILSCVSHSTFATISLFFSKQLIFVCFLFLYSKSTIFHAYSSIIIKGEKSLPNWCYIIGTFYLYTHFDVSVYSKMTWNIRCWCDSMKESRFLVLFSYTNNSLTIERIKNIKITRSVLCFECSVPRFLCARIKYKIYI